MDPSDREQCFVNSAESGRVLMVVFLIVFSQRSEQGLKEGLGVH